jgi:predicted MFS family arabinose efflux permease
MSTRPLGSESGGSSEKLILPSLGLTRFALQLPRILTGLLLIDIAATFGVSVGVMGQIRTVSAAVGVFGALLMGFLSVRYRHKSLLLAGLLFLGVSTLGCAFSPDFGVMLLMFSLVGVAGVMANPMSTALVGELLPVERRAGTVGWMIGASALAYLVGAPVIAFVEGLGGWRTVFLVFVLPTSILSLLLAHFGIPVGPGDHGRVGGDVSYSEAFRAVFTNKSAAACLIGSLLVMAVWSTHLAFSASFIRQRFMVSTGFASVSTIVGAFSFIVGSVTSGRIVNRMGRKRVTSLTAAPAGLLLLLYYSITNLWVALLLGWAAALVNGMLTSANNNLTLEQVPRHRGTMMSINTAAGSLGSTIGTGMGGWMLLSYGYLSLGSMLGAMGVAAAAIYFSLVKEPLLSQ